ncbi:MAG: radical SAM protein [Clostridia bacterium]|nr:radical SAM protein [Clostridia bacterium]
MNKKNSIIDIKTGFQCNNNCIFCAQGDKRNFGKTQTTEEIKKTLSESISSFEGVVLTGGEVTIRKDFLELVSFAKDCGYKNIFIQTNGRMFSYLELCKRTIEAGATNFSLSLHGSTPEIHDGLTRIEGGFEQTLKGIKNLLELGAFVSTNTVVMKTNYLDMPNVAKLLTKIRVSSYQLSFMDINPVIERSEEMIQEIVPRYKEVRESIENALQLGIDQGVRCKVEAFPFCTLGEKYHSHIPGKKFSNYFVFDGERMTDMIKRRKEKLKWQGEKCRDCKFYNTCEGPWSNYPKIFGVEEFKSIK